MWYTDPHSNLSYMHKYTYSVSDTHPFMTVVINRVKLGRMGATGACSTITFLQDLPYASVYGPAPIAPQAAIH